MRSTDRLSSLRVSAEGFALGKTRAVPEEVPVAIVHDGSTYAVMMASPGDLEDFAVGFSLVEGVIASPSDITGLEVVESDIGIELRMWLAPHVAKVAIARRRAITGPTGCGLCGIESLEAATTAPTPVATGVSVTAADVAAALAALSEAQVLGRETRATHAAGLWSRRDGLVALREDVGRHNALDKLIGATVRAGRDTAGDLVVVTSRISVEMVQKTAVLGVGLLVAVSAPTTLAIRTAEAANITLVGVARSDGFEVFTHSRRILTRTPAPTLSLETAVDVG